MKYNRERLIKLSLLAENAARQFREMGRAADLLRVEVPGYAKAAARVAQIVEETTGAKGADDGIRPRQDSQDSRRTYHQAG